MPAELLGSLPADDEVYTSKTIIITKEKDTRPKGEEPPKEAEKPLHS